MSVKCVTRVGVGTALLGLSLSATALDLIAGSGAASNCPTSGRSVAATVGAVAWLQPAPVTTYDDYGGDYYAPDRASNRGVGIGFAEIAAAGFGLCVGAIYRHEYLGVASKDLLDVLIGSRHDQPFNPGRTYALSMDFSAFQATGLRLRKVFEYDLRKSWSLKIGVGASFLNGEKGQQQSIRGDIAANSGSWATGTANWLRVQSDLDADDFNPYVTRGDPRALGYSTDLELILRSSSGWEANFAVMDLYGSLHWRDLPMSVKQLDNAQIAHNENLDQNAAVVGLDSVISLKRRIEPKYHLALVTRPLHGWSAVVSDDAVEDLHFPAIGVRHRAGAHSVDLSYDLRTEALTLAVGMSALRLSLSMDNSDPGRANVLGWVLQSAYAW